MDESLLDLLLSTSVSVKKLKLLGSPDHGPSGCGGMNREVHVTQPCSLPTSPTGSPIPPTVMSSHSASSSPTTFRGINQNTCSGNGSHQGVNTLKGDRLFSGQGNTDDIYWQTTKSGVRERNAAMCNNELMADVHFIVSCTCNGSESRRYPAHKYVLAVGSSVFFAMFYGNLAETVDEVTVPDAEPDAFLKMLK